MTGVRTFVVYTPDYTRSKVKLAEKDLRCLVNPPDSAVSEPWAQTSCSEEQGGKQ